MESQTSTFSHNFPIIQESILYFYQFLALGLPYWAHEDKTCNVTLSVIFLKNSNVVKQELLKGDE